MPDKQPSLYGKRKIKKENPTASTSSNLSFATQLSSLISQDTGPSHGRARPSKTPKTDLFAKANKGSEKRAAADLRSTDHTQQPHKSSKDIGTIDNATLNRSKRKMAEKVKLYEDMKKGEYLRRDSDDEDEEPREKKARTEEYHARLRRKEKEGLVDFDRKWAEEERQGDDSRSESEDDDNASMISYEDEFGRTRRGTRKEAARAARDKEDAEDRGRSTAERWKPARPDNLIYGATVQSEAFNPEETIAAQMARLAARRDRSATPPEATHYDADAEVRNRGTGFYAFSSDPEERKRQMEELTSARRETEARRRLQADRGDEWEQRLEARRRELGELRAKRMIGLLEREIFANSSDAGHETRTETETSTETSTEARTESHTESQPDAEPTQ